MGDVKDAKVAKMSAKPSATERVVAGEPQPAGQNLQQTRQHSAPLRLPASGLDLPELGFFESMT